MIELEFKVENRGGIHARPAGYLRSLAKEFDCKILLRKIDSDTDYDVSNVISVMSGNFRYGDNIFVQVISKSDKPVDVDKVIPRLKNIFREEKARS